MKKPIKDRLFEKRKIDPITGCWLWMGGKFLNGYGTIKVKGKSNPIHRLSLEIFKGVIFGKDEQANHIRECPYKHCFNPDHLYKGTQKQNMADLKSKRPPPKSRIEKNREYYARHNQHRKDFGRLKLET